MIRIAGFLLMLLLLTPCAWAGTRVILDTTYGSITVELEDEKAPESTKNFLAYVDSGFYSGTIFHRVIRNFVIQGGGFTQAMSKKATRKPIVNEADNGLRNLRGTLSMARTQDLNSATSQFFVNLRDNAALDHRGKSRSAFGYAVFGRVIEGMEVVDKIASVPTTTRPPYSDVPRIPVLIKSAKRVVQ